jgi:hypothetical protein
MHQMPEHAGLSGIQARTEAAFDPETDWPARRTFVQRTKSGMNGLANQ